MDDDDFMRRMSSTPYTSWSDFDTWQVVAVLLEGGDAGCVVSVPEVYERVLTLVELSRSAPLVERLDGLVGADRAWVLLAERVARAYVAARAGRPVAPRVEPDTSPARVPAVVAPAPAPPQVSALTCERAADDSVSHREDAGPDRAPNPQQLADELRDADLPKLVGPSPRWRPL